MREELARLDEMLAVATSADVICIVMAKAYQRRLVRHMEAFGMITQTGRADAQEEERYSVKTYNGFQVVSASLNQPPDYAALVCYEPTLRRTMVYRA